MAGKSAAVMVAALALATPPLALAGPGGIGPPDPATPSGEAITDIYWIVFGVTAAIFVLVEAALLLFVVRFRRRRGTAEDAEGPQIHGNTRLEVLWTIIPVLVLVAIATVTVLKVPSVSASPARGEDRLRVRVDAHQFYWQYVYPNGVIALDKLRLPVDRRVTLELVSPDVAHSWWVPELTGKLDAIPGRTNVLNLEATRTGVFRGRCAEFCGIQHAVMTTEVEVVSQEEFDAWLAEQAAAQRSGQSDLGRQSFEAACAKCHGLAGEGDIGPPIKGNAALTDPDSLRTLLFEGQDTPGLPGFMPPVGKGWDDGQIDALLGYLAESLSAGEASGG